MASSGSAAGSGMAEVVNAAVMLTGASMVSAQ